MSKLKTQMMDPESAIAAIPFLFSTPEFLNNQVEKSV
jgi:hypothetical protein